MWLGPPGSHVLFTCLCAVEQLQLLSVYAVSNVIFPFFLEEEVQAMTRVDTQTSLSFFEGSTRKIDSTVVSGRHISSSCTY